MLLPRPPVQVQYARKLRENQEAAADEEDKRSSRDGEIPAAGSKDKALLDFWVASVPLDSWEVVQAHAQPPETFAAHQQAGNTRAVATPDQAAAQQPRPQRQAAHAAESALPGNDSSMQLPQPEGQAVTIEPTLPWHKSLPLPSDKSSVAPPVAPGPPLPSCGSPQQQQPPPPQLAARDGFDAPVAAAPAPVQDAQHAEAAALSRHDLL
jgi:hypothetical protein